MTNGKHAVGNVPDRDAANSANAAGSTPVGSASADTDTAHAGTTHTDTAHADTTYTDTPHSAASTEQDRGWRSDEVVRDQEGRRDGSSGWNSEDVVRDQGGNEPAAATGWSGSEVVRDRGEVPNADVGGWSGSEVVKDHGDLAAGVADAALESPRHDVPQADR